MTKRGRPSGQGAVKGASSVMTADLYPWTFLRREADLAVEGDPVEFCGRRGVVRQQRGPVAVVEFDEDILVRGVDNNPTRTLTINRERLTVVRRTQE